MGGDEVSAVAEIETAIAKITELREASSPAPWTAWKQRRQGYVMTCGIEDTRGEITAIAMTMPDAQLVEVMHRTIDAQLAFLVSVSDLNLGDGLDGLSGSGFFGKVVNLARAINGTP